MKTKRKVLLAAVVMGILMLCAFTVIPTVRLLYGGQNKVDVSYLDAKVSEDTLKLTVNYDSVGEYFEIGRDIVVATDNNFDNPLKMKKCNVVDGNYVYEFETENLNSLEKVYIKPPILYMPAEITPVSVPMAVGEVAKMSAEDTELETASTNWFSVDTVDIEEDSEGTYKVRVLVKANAKDLPRFPKLVNGETRIGGISALNFDKNNNFDYGEFLFTVNAGSEKEAAMMAASSSLVVSDALIRVDASDLAISSNVKSLSVVGGESE